MNYLSHYYFFRKKEDPYFNCGIIFPDWLAAFNRSKLKHELVCLNPEENKLANGIQMHYAGDNMFHGSDFFRETTHGIKLILEKSTLDKEKLRFSFLAHLLLEMMADRILLKKYPDLGLEFYDDLDHCDNRLLLQFALRNGSCDGKFLELISGFKKHRFILHYIKNENFVYALNRITGRVGIGFNEEERLQLEGKIDIIEAYVNENWYRLLKLFKS